MPTYSYTDEEYRKDFLTDPEVNREALAHALDIRKFEIELYWRRAAYFWTFIGAALAGYVAIQTSDAQNKEDMSVLIACLGFVLSFGWMCAIRGSKHWQENWENHVDMLEDHITGPLYKVVMRRSRPKGVKEWGGHLVTGPSEISVSKINQIISIFFVIIWAVLLMYSLPPFDLKAGVNWFYVTLVVLAVVACAAFLFLGRTYGGGYWHRAARRTSKINDEA